MTGALSQQSFKPLCGFTQRFINTLHNVVIDAFTSLFFYGGKK